MLTTGQQSSVYNLSAHLYCRMASSDERLPLLSGMMEKDQKGIQDQPEHWKAIESCVGKGEISSI